MVVIGAGPIGNPGGMELLDDFSQPSLVLASHITVQAAADPRVPLFAHPDFSYQRYLFPAL